MAWLHAVPNYEDKDRPRLSRLKEFEEFEVDYDEPPLPRLTAYLVEWLYEAGIVMDGGAALTWQEVEAFERASCLSLDAWERQALMAMSRTYAMGLTAHQDPQSPPPYVSDDDPLGRQRRERANG